MVLFVVDVRAGPDAARRGGRPPAALRRQAGAARRQQVRHAASSDRRRGDFYKLGRGESICVSAEQNRGKAELLDADRQASAAGRRRRAPAEDVSLKLAIVGRRNAGKSTFINCLAEANG